MRWVFQLPIARQAGARRPFPGAHGVALPGDGEAGAAWLADVAGDQIQVVDRAHAVGPVRGLVDAHGPDRHRRAGLAVQARHSANGVFVDAADLRRARRIVLGDCGGELVVAVCASADRGLVVKAVFEDHMAQAVQEHQIRAWRHCQVDVRHLGEHRHPRIDHDDGKLAPLQRFLEPPVDDRMLLRQVGAERQQALGVIEIAVAARRPVGTEGTLVAGDRRRHAQRGVAIVVVGADDAAHQLAEGVELLRHDLAGGDHGHGIAPVAGLDTLEAVRHAVQRRVPIGLAPLLGDPVAHFRLAAAAGGGENLRLGQPFDAQLAAVDVRTAHPAGGHRLAAGIHAHFDGTAHRAIAAGGVLPLGNRLRGDANGVLAPAPEQHRQCAT